MKVQDSETAMVERDLIENLAKFALFPRHFR